MVRDVYVAKDHLYLCVESLIQIDMCNDSVDKIFFFLKRERGSISAGELPRKIFIYYYMLYDMRPKKEMARSILHINEGNKIRMWKTRRGFSTMIL